MWKCIQRFQTSAKPKSTFKKATGKKEEEAERDVTSRSPLGLTGSSGTGATGTELVNTCDKVNLISRDLLEMNKRANWMNQKRKYGQFQKN